MRFPRQAQRNGNPIACPVVSSRVTITFREQQAGAWRTDVDIRGGDGSARLMRTVVAPDGSVAQVVGDTAEADSIAMKLPAPNVLVMVLGKGGVPTSTRVYTVASNGKSMTETVGYAKDGKPFMRTNYFKRVD